MMEKKSRISRRKFLAVSTGAAVGGVAAGAVVGGLAGYFLGASQAAPAVTRTVTSEVTRTVTGPGATVTTTVQAPAKRLKVGYIYVGPVGDYGWTFAHNEGRKFADAAYKNVDSFYIESVPEAQSAGAIESLINQGADLVITTSFGYMDSTAEVAAKYPDKYFVHISGYRSGAAGNAPQNMSSAFAEFYQLYYLNGLAAGAVTQTGVVGYVAAFPIPEVVRHINAFVLGANYAYKKRTGRNIKAYVSWLFAWFDPGKAREAAVALIEQSNADVLAFTEDTPTTLQVAEEYTTQKGRRVWSFSHYNDMSSYGPNAHLTGQIVNWGPIYLDFYRMVATGTWRTVDIWTRIGDYMPYRWRRSPEQSTAGQVDGTLQLGKLNPAIPSEWQLEIKKRYEEMKELLFEPFSVDGNLGEPIRDQKGEVRIKGSERADRDMLWNMDWFVEYIQSELPR
ncbi:simple sugar ABC transporter substrate-binding protein [Candidatus Caldarchaeum subterraneum]|uniref:Simple sugar ABC transporter substrate-binding protein n=1 Tax=Caldiarchaeum subterraneum TaxID=311458 RepID=E6N9H1_CALS0|nr:simple sugar ABC transporter substrate-binding protein [Candidatus Caldarchaeum subterraneum]BAJ51561.1 simple sugar ABC transporter substrate-binding protein [Candidatus Caldarchaeum subterraneum]